MLAVRIYSAIRVDLIVAAIKWRILIVNYASMDEWIASHQFTQKKKEIDKPVRWFVSAPIGKCIGLSDHSRTLKQ